MKNWIKHCFQNLPFHTVELFPAADCIRRSLSTTWLARTLPQFKRVFLMTMDICSDRDVKTTNLYNSRRCRRRPRRQTESELTNLTPMSAFSLRNRYLSRLGAQVCSDLHSVVTGGGKSRCRQTRFFHRQGRAAMASCPNECGSGGRLN